MIISERKRQLCVEQGSRRTTVRRLDIYQKEKLYEVIRQFTDVLQNTQGRMNLTVHHIETGSALPVCLPPYRLPHAY